ncbi:MAG: alpha/beta fold hydrolase [Anaerolineae bacterium]|nr:alpha/beta fold hydrolase [Anaerolineae bacterium]
MPMITINSRTMYYEDHGHGFPIIFGHSYLWDNEMWQPQVAALSATYRCIVPDLWGHGRSAPPPADSYSIEELAEDMWAFTQALGLEQFAVVGSSVGGIWATHLTLNHPEAVSALVLMDTYLGSEPPEAFAHHFGMLSMIEQIGTVPAPMQDEIVPFFFSPVTMQQAPNIVNRFKVDLSSFEVAQVPGLVSIGHGIFSRTSQLNRLPEITAPTMIIVGADDKSRPPHAAQQMADSIPDATLKIIANAGHVSNLEQPHQVTPLLNGFLQQALEKNLSFAAI